MIPLPATARYTPWMSGAYSVSPGLRPLQADFGNGPLDRQLVQFDTDWARYRRNKVAALAEDPPKYVCHERFEGHLRRAVERTLRERIFEAHPDLFTVANGGYREILTGETFANDDWRDLAFRLPCDMAVVARSEGRDWIAALHLCAPSHWAAADKIGRSFFTAHRPVPGFDRVNAAADRLVDACISGAPLVRFVWGVESDAYLNHHPDPAPGHDPRLWAGRNFGSGRFWVRTERQTTLGIPAADAFLFFIQVQTVPGDDLSADERNRLRLAIESMSDVARAYKGLDREYEALMALLAPVP